MSTDRPFEVGARVMDLHDNHGTVTGYVRDSIGVAWDGGGTSVAPVSHGGLRPEPHIEEFAGEGAGEVVARFGSVFCHLFLTPAEGTAYGFLRHPKDPGSDLAAMVTGEDPQTHADRWWAECAEDQDHATAWAFAQGFRWASDEPVGATDEGQDSPYATWVLVPVESDTEFEGELS